MRECCCCHKAFSQDHDYVRIYCLDCAKKITKQIHKLRRKEHPFAFWKWNTCTCREVDEIVEKIQQGIIK